MARAVLLLLVMMLAACDAAGGGGAFTDSRTPPGLSPRFWAPSNWAWGLIRPKSRPDIRYGVAAPVGVSRGDVIILPGYGETAEAWFETASDLIKGGYTVWIMDGAGQGGSGRFAPTRDLGHVPDFDSDIYGLRAIIDVVIRPAPGRRPIVIASGSAALPALAATERGLDPALLILSDPDDHAVKASRLTAALARAGLSTLRAGGEEAWKRPDPKAQATARVRASQAWAVANPDLRMGGVSWGWVKARRALANQTLAAGALAKVSVPVLLITSERARLPCSQISRCSEQLIAATGPYAFEEDAVRQRWLAVIFQALPDDHAL